MRAVLIAALAFVTSPAAAEDLESALLSKYPGAEIQTLSTVDFDYQNFYLDRGRAKVVLKVTNNTARHVDMAFLECAFLADDERALDTATLIASNLSAGGEAYVDGWSARLGGIEHVSCRVSHYR